MGFEPHDLEVMGLARTPGSSTPLCYTHRGRAFKHCFIYPDMTTVLVYGDSTVQGFWDTEGGWVQRLRSYLDKKFLNNPDCYYPLFNLGVSGDTSKDLLERFQGETKNRLNEAQDKNEVIIILSVGTNDSMVINKSNKNQIEISNFANNLKELISLAKKYSNTIIFVGDMPVDEDKVDPIPWHDTASYRNEFVKTYQDVAENVCKEQGILFIDLYSVFIRKSYKTLLEDGCHPNNEGHKMIFEIVRDELKNRGIIP